MEAFSQVHRFPSLPHAEAPVMIWFRSFYAADLEALDEAGEQTRVYKDDNYLKMTEQRKPTVQVKYLKVDFNACTAFHML